MNKNKIIIISVSVALIIVAGVGAYMVLGKNLNPGNSTMPNSSNQPNNPAQRGGNPMNIVQGKILSISGNDIVVDGVRGQMAAIIDDKTVITDVVATDRTKVIKEGSTVSLQYTGEDDSAKVTTVTAVSEQQFMSPQENQNVSSTGPQTMQGNRRGNFGNGGQQFMPSGTPNASRARVIIGKIVSISGQNIEISVRSSASEESNKTFDVSSASFLETKTIAKSSLKIGDTIRGFGSKSGASILLRTIQKNDVP